MVLNARMSPRSQKKDHEPRDTTEQATAGSRMWDKLLMATGSVSKTIASRIKDTGYDSGDDEEGVETHVIKCLKDYYTNKGEGVPTWLGGSGTMAMPQPQQQEYGSRATEGGRSSQEPSQGMTRSATGTMRNKVTLRGIYEQAQERTSHQHQQQQQQQPMASSSAATRLSPQRLDTSMTRQRSAPQDLSPGAAAGGGASAYGRTGMGQPGPGAGGVSAGERFRERMKLNRAASAGGQAGAAGANGGGGGDPRLRRGGEGSRF